MGSARSVPRHARNVARHPGWVCRLQQGKQPGTARHLCRTSEPVKFIQAHKMAKNTWSNGPMKPPPQAARPLGDRPAPLPRPRLRPRQRSSGRRRIRGESPSGATSTVRAVIGIRSAIRVRAMPRSGSVRSATDQRRGPQHPHLPHPLRRCDGHRSAPRGFGATGGLASRRRPGRPGESTRCAHR